MSAIHIKRTINKTFCGKGFNENRHFGLTGKTTDSLPTSSYSYSDCSSCRAAFEVTARQMLSNNQLNDLVEASHNHRRKYE